MTDIAAQEVELGTEGAQRKLPFVTFVELNRHLLRVLLRKESFGRG